MARWRKPTPPPSILRRAAQYVRMSTEHQQYSIANQSAAIALYGAAHKIGIVRSFVDAGKIGTTIKRRVGLQELLRVVESGSADFTDVLVYDVSRWGRFPDCDESAHYEFLCKRAGIAVHYCAEQFENDNSLTSTLLKALKRTMASEYSRELSVKISAGQHRLAGMGFWQGGNPPFGMLRLLVDENGRRKRLLARGECKSISTDRIVLSPGPKDAVETVRLAYDLYTKQKKSRREIARILNTSNRLGGKSLWTVQMLRDLYNDPIYKGAYTYAKHDQRFGQFKHRPPEMWITREHAFPAIISDQQWDQAKARIADETKPLLDSEMLESLRRLWKRKGHLNSTMINASVETPSTSAYRKHFDGVGEAYKLIG
jgi:DNA invertase Pin-like site-specific DNA recombinase